MAQAVEQRTQRSGFSWLRIGYLFVAGLFVTAAVLGFNLVFTQGV
jgi:hypothetical protein